MRVGIVGATGQAGSVMRSVLAEGRIPVDTVRFFASSRSAGRRLDFHGGTVEVEDAATADFSGLDVVLSAAGATSSRTLSPRIADAGAIVVDEFVRLAHAPRGPPRRAGGQRRRTRPDTARHRRQSQLHDHGRHARAPPPGPGGRPPAPHRGHLPGCLGGGTRGGVRARAAGDQDGRLGGRARPSTARRCTSLPAKFPGPIAHNVLPLAGSLLDDGSGETDEERKYVNESRKILGLPEHAVSCTCVRVPVFTGHSAAILAEFDRELAPERATEILVGAPGVSLSEMPTPLSAAGRDACLVGRIRRASGADHALSLFVVGDNLRKGAALTPIQIAGPSSTAGSCPPVGSPLGAPRTGRGWHGRPPRRGPLPRPPCTRSAVVSHPLCTLAGKPGLGSSEPSSWE